MSKTDTQRKQAFTFVEFEAVKRVRVDSSTMTCTPEVVEVDTSDQVVRWETDAPGISVSFPTKPIKGALYSAGKNYCALSRIPMGNKGTHKYTVRVVLADGSVKRRDPDVIINY